MRPRIAATSRDAFARLSVADHERLKRVAMTRGLPLRDLSTLAILSYLDYLENGQWAVALPLDLVQPTIEAARAAGVSVPAWIETTLRDVLQRPVETKRRSTGPIGRPREKSFYLDNPRIFCRCGCGGTLEKYDPYGRPRQYLMGHWFPQFLRKRKKTQDVAPEGS